MSTDALNVLSSFDALPLAEQQVVAAAITNRVASCQDKTGLTAETESEDPSAFEEWAAEFKAWGRSHSLRNLNVDASRDSIYEGRGE